MITSAPSPWESVGQLRRGRLKVNCIGFEYAMWLRISKFGTQREEQVNRFGLRLHRQPPHTSEIEGGAGQRQFHPHFVQASQAKASQPALLFQDSNHGLDQALAPAIASLACGTAQSRSHAHMLRRVSRTFQWSPVLFQFSGQMRVRQKALN